MTAAVAGRWAAELVYNRQRRRLGPLVAQRLPDERVEDFAVVHKRSSLWPSMVGIGVLIVGAVLVSAERVDVDLLPQSGLVFIALPLGLAFVLAGALLMPARLIVTTSSHVVIFSARRRTHEPAALVERIQRSSWVTRDEVRRRGLFVPSLWRAHLARTGMTG